jgi:hypothetical protein
MSDRRLDPLCLRDDVIAASPAPPRPADGAEALYAQILKRHLLAAAGFVCVAVPYWEWMALAGRARPGPPSCEQTATNCISLRRCLQQWGGGRGARR